MCVHALSIGTKINDLGWIWIRNSVDSFLISVSKRTNFETAAYSSKFLGLILN